MKLIYRKKALNRERFTSIARQFDAHTHEKLILLAIHDITDTRKVEKGLAETEQLLEESRERLRFAIASAGIGTCDFSPISGELILDSKCRELFDLTPDELINYPVFLQHVHQDDRSATDEAINRTLKGLNKSDFNIEFRSVAVKGGKPCWIKFKGKAYFNKEKNATRFTGTMLDFSAEKTVEESTKELLRKKDEFMSIASHELKTPITSIRAILQILDRSVSQKEELQPIYPFVQKANNQANKLVDLVKNLLDVTKIQTGKLELDKSNFLIKELIEECREETLLKANDLKINVDGPQKLSVFADKNRIGQVLTNLIDNAVKYSPDGNLINIKITKGPKAVRVAVTDFGIGIPKNKMPFVFDRFFRVDEAGKNYSGLGLGLYISAEIVKRHKGTIGVESELAKGSTSWFTIPVKKKVAAVLS